MNYTMQSVCVLTVWGPSSVYALEKKWFSPYSFIPWLQLIECLNAFSMNFLRRSESEQGNARCEENTNGGKNGMRYANAMNWNVGWCCANAKHQHKRRDESMCIIRRLSVCYDENTIVSNQLIELYGETETTQLKIMHSLVTTHSCTHYILQRPHPKHWKKAMQANQ